MRVYDKVEIIGVGTLGYVLDTDNKTYVDIVMSGNWYTTLNILDVSVVKKYDDLNFLNKLHLKYKIFIGTAL